MNKNTAGSGLFKRVLKETVPLLFAVAAVLAIVVATGVSSVSKLQAQTSTSTPVAPAAPYNLSVTVSGINAGLSWADSDPTVTGFKMYKTINGLWTDIGNVSAGTFSYLDNNVTPGTSYDYKVQAFTQAEGGSPVYSGVSNVVTATIPAHDTTPPTAPGSVTFTTSGLAVTLSWQASTDNVGVAEYRVYRNSPSNPSNYAYMGSAGTALTYTDTAPAAGAYSYQVIARDAANNYSPTSNTVTATVNVPGGDATPPTVPSNLLQTATGTTVYLYWQPSTDNVGVAGYNVYRNNNLITTVTATNYADSGLSAGSYTYQVKAADAAGNLSDFSNAVTATVAGSSSGSSGSSSGSGSSGGSSSSGSSGSSATSTAPAAPSNMAASSSNGKVYLSWTDNSNNESGFKMYRYSAGLWTDIGNVGPNITSSVDSAVTIGQAYGYRVQAFIQSNGGTPVYSAVSNAVSVAVVSGQPTATSTPPTTTSAPTSTPPTATSTITNLARLAGVVTDQNNNPVAGASVHVYSSDYSINQGTVTASNGSYYVYAQAGNLFVDVTPPSNRTDLSKITASPVTVIVGQSSILNLQFSTIVYSKIISGTITFSNGQPVTDAVVVAYNTNSSVWVQASTTSSGTFRLNAGPGDWQVSFHPQNPQAASWQWLGNYSTVSFNNDTTSEEKVMNFIVPLAQAQINVSVTDNQNKPLAGAGVIVDSNQSSAMSQYKKTDANGQASFSVSPGTFYVRAYLPDSSGLIAPAAQRVSVSDGNNIPVQLVFSSQSASTASAVTGQVILADGTAVADATIWAWSEQGGSASTKSGPLGNFGMMLDMGQKWHVGSAKEINSQPYKSSEIILSLQNISNLQLTLVPISAPAATAIIVTKEATQPILAVAGGGVSVNIPAGAAASSGQVNVAVTPTVETPSQPQAQVVGSAFDVNVTDASGKAITQLTSDMELRFPFNKVDLFKQGIKPGQLEPSYFDPTSGAWVQLNDFTIDTTNNVVVAHVSHLTRFALVAPADVTPPVAPINVQGARSGKTQVTVIWTDPAVNFHHSKIYRSTKRGSLGELINPLITDSQFIDTNVTINKLYYYSIVEVSPAGNESEPSSAISVRVSGRIRQIAPAVPPHYFTKYLSKGRSGQDVKFLQQLLSVQDFYAAGITGKFDSATVAAVKKFQTARGIKATGALDLRTRDELNKI